MGIGRRLTDRVIDRELFPNVMGGVVGVFSGAGLGEVVACLLGG